MDNPYQFHVVTNGRFACPGRETLAIGQDGDICECSQPVLAERPELPPVELNRTERLLYKCDCGAMVDKITLSDGPPYTAYCVNCTPASAPAG